MAPLIDFHYKCHFIYLWCVVVVSHFNAKPNLCQGLWSGKIEIGASLFESKSGQNRDKMNIVINLTQSTYHQTLNIGKILRKSGQNRDK